MTILVTRKVMSVSKENRMSMDDDHILGICMNAYRWARDQNFMGYSKFDALNSSILKRISGNSYILRRGFPYVINKFPINIRPLFGIQKKQNPKGLALFARSCLNLYSITSNELWIKEAMNILELLLHHSRTGDYSGHCWGYDHPWQNMTFYAPAHTPNTVVTVNVAEAFIDGYELTEEDRYLNIATSSIEFFKQDLAYMNVGDEGLCCSYVPGSNWKVINVNALVASLYARLYNEIQKEELKERAYAHLKWVMNHQTDNGAWYYSVPPDQSTIKIDNYHTGFVLDSIASYEKLTGDTRWHLHLERGLRFYEEHLFLENGAPKWESEKTFPLDVHSAAQGIITFSQMKREDMASRILSWTLKNLYNEKENRFYYQKYKYFTKHYTLLRWCQAWMTYAISVYMKSFPDTKDTSV